ncbi:hypothetical protein RUND412_010689 [Rhizina undulata]
MVSFLRTFLLFAFAAFSFAAAYPADKFDERQSTDWGNYVFIASEFSGIVGQNIALIALPGNRAVCPLELWNLQSCASSFESECIQERFVFQWCLNHRITSGTCDSEWIDTTLSCIGGTSADCVTALTGLNSCATSITVPPLSTGSSG